VSMTPRTRWRARLTRSPDDPWRLPALQEFGARLGDLEREGPETRGPGSAPRRALVLALCGCLAGAVLVAVLTIRPGTTASAMSIVNRAPGLAERSASARFLSQLTATYRGRTVRAFLGYGEIDFTTGAYRTVLERVGKPGALERRRTGDTLYVKGSRRDASSVTSSRGVASSGSAWVAYHLTRGQQSKLSPAPGADALTDPLALLRVLRLTRAPTVPDGGATLEGVQTQRYTLSSDLASILRASGASEEPPREYARVRARIEVWLDHKGRPVRVSALFQRDSAPAGDSLRSVVTFTGYGEPVQILAPSGARRSRGPEGGAPLAFAIDPSALYARLLFGGD